MMEFFKSPKFLSRVEGLMNQHHVPGLSIAIVQDDQVASAGFGQASIDPAKPCTADTLFDIASSSKSFTAASVALLVEDRQLPDVQWDAIMSELLPGDFVMPSAVYTEGVTVDDVVGHRTGMAGHDSSYMGIRAEQPDDARSITRNLRNLPVAAPLRSRYLYNNMMYTAATYLVEVKSKQGFSDFLQDRIFQPLDMHFTGLQPSALRLKGLGDRMAMGYVWDKKEASYCGFESQDCPEGQGAGSIIASANDLIKWVKALMHREGPISEKVYQGLTRMRSFVNPTGRRLKPHTSPSFYTAGMEIYYYRGETVIGHDGGVPGFRSRFMFLPDFKFGAVVLGNAEGAGPVATTVLRELMDVVLKVSQAAGAGGDRPSNKGGDAASELRRADLPMRPKVQLQSREQSLEEEDRVNKSKRDVVMMKKKRREKTKRSEKEADEDASSSASKNKAKPQQARGTDGRMMPPPAQETTLDAYAGKYWHPGYHLMTVQIRDSSDSDSGGNSNSSNTLFVDATDRSMGFTLAFEHVKDQTRYTARLCDALEGGDERVDAEFVLGEDGVAVKMGLDLEPVLREKIWFERMAEEA